MTLAAIMVLPLAHAGAQMDRGLMMIDEVTHLDGDSWRAAGRATDADCRPPHRVGVMEMTGPTFPDDVSSARTIDRVQGTWSVEFEAPFEEIVVVLFCDEIHVNQELSRALVRGTRDDVAGAPDPPSPETRGAPVGLVAGGAAAAVAAVAAALVLRARRPARRDAGGHAACVARHEAASKRVTAAKGHVRSLSGVDALGPLDGELKTARDAFDGLLGEEATAEVLVDDYVRSIDG